ncbi:hypothetical protein ACOME3_006986 [Neoechinorhynchus agilis]
MPSTRNTNATILNGQRKRRLQCKVEASTSSSGEMLDQFAVKRRRRVQKSMTITCTKQKADINIGIDDLKNSTLINNNCSSKPELLFNSNDQKSVIDLNEFESQEPVLIQELLTNDTKQRKRPHDLVDDSVEIPPVKKIDKIRSKLLSKPNVVSNEEFNRLKNQLIARYKDLNRHAQDQSGETRKKYSDFAKVATKQSDSRTELPLPPCFAILLTIFKQIDVILNFQYIRHREVPFKEIQEAVSQMNPRIRLRLSHVAMIRRIFAHAFQYGLKRVDDNEKSVEGDSVTLDGKRRHLTLKFGFDGTRDYFKTRSDILGTSENMDFEWTESRLDRYLGNSNNAFAAGFLARRANIFQELLLNETKIQHGLFLEKRGICNRSTVVKRWHPEFILSEIPFPLEAEMPEIQNHEIVSDGAKFIQLAGALDSIKTRQSMYKIDEKDSFQQLSTSDIPEDVVKLVAFRESKRKLVEYWKETEQFHLIKLKKELPSVVMSIYELFEMKRARVLNYEHIQSQAMLCIQHLSHAAFDDIANIIGKDFADWIYMIELRSGQRYFKLKRNIPRSEFKEILKSWILKYNASVKEHPDFVCSMKIL